MEPKVLTGLGGGGVTEGRLVYGEASNDIRYVREFSSNLLYYVFPVWKASEILDPSWIVDRFKVFILFRYTPIRIL